MKVLTSCQLRLGWFVLSGHLLLHVDQSRVRLRRLVVDQIAHFRRWWCCRAHGVNRMLLSTISFLFAVFSKTSPLLS